MQQLRDVSPGRPGLVTQRQRAVYHLNPAVRLIFMIKPTPPRRTARTARTCRDRNAAPKQRGVLTR
ncbi:hypothetical protein DZD18_13825 [Rhodobacteraceae bacterium W635]|nr:hypothetical protein DZD18_13825 [Rhodobacteraceae bacterium W635]